MENTKELERAKDHLAKASDHLFKAAKIMKGQRSGDEKRDRKLVLIVDKADDTWVSLNHYIGG